MRWKRILLSSTRKAFGASWAEVEGPVAKKSKDRARTDQTVAERMESPERSELRPS